MEAPSSTPSKAGENHGTRRNTRSTSNQDKDKDNADSSKSGSSGNNTAKDQDLSNNETSKKKQSEKVVRAPNGDVLEYTTEDDITYRPMDSAYLDTERPDNPYFICTIQEIKVSKRDNAIVSVKWYYRPTEVPDLVYQMLVKDRYNQVVDPAVKDLVMKPDVVNRELFVDDRKEATDTYPISCLRGKCDVTHFSNILDIKNFELRPDHFFSIYSYSPDSRRLASSKGETRVGPSHQWNASMRGIFQKADVPDLLTPSERGYEKGRVYEEMTWEPKVNKCDLIMCLRAARSLAAFAGVCDGVSPEEGCIVASRDDTTINALRVLFVNNGNPRKAIDALVKNPVPVTIESKWTEEQVRRFQRGLKLYGKNFFKIRKELLPMKATGELVEFYYLWKKTQDNLMIRPNHGKHKRQAAMKKAGKHKSSNGNGSGDQTSTEEETEESEESEKETSNTKKCKHCETSTSKDWSVGGKDSVMLCTDCRVFFKKYGENRPVIRVEDIDSANETDIDTPPAAKSQVPPFLFKPIKEEKVNNLIPRKPAKSLAKVNTPTEIKVKAEKPNKRQWSDSEEIKVKQEVLSTKLKRPKTEPDDDDNHSQNNQDASHETSEMPILEAIKDDMAPPERKPYPVSSGLPPSILPTKAIHPLADEHASLSLKKSAFPTTESFTHESSKHPIPSYGFNTLSASSTLVPFVSSPQGSHPLPGKPSELEAISKLAFNPGVISRTICPTVGYVGAGTPPTLPTSMPTTGQTSSTYSLSGTTTVTMTNTIRSSPVAEPSGSSIPKASGETSRPPAREGLPMRDAHHMNPRAVDPSYNLGSRLSPHPPRSDKEDKSGQYHRAKMPPTSTVRNARFPFDPCVTDQIISNANMSRPMVKEEARPSSPSRPHENRRPVHPHMGPVRSSPVPHLHIKQESYPGHINPQTSRPYLPGEPTPHPAYPGHQRSHTQSPNPHGPLPVTLGPRHPVHHPLPHRAAPIQTSRSSSPRQSYSVSGRGQPPLSQDDSDVEVIGESPPAEVKEPAHFGHSAKFIKVWDRGTNSCFRTDYIYAPDESSVRKRVEKQKEFRKEQPQTSTALPSDPSKPPPPKRPRTPSSHRRLSSEQDRKREERTESMDRSRREGHGPPSASSLPPQAHRSTPGHASVPSATPTRTPTTAYDQHHRPTPAPFVSPLSSLGSDTPALRQLQQYASNDMRRNAAAEAAMGAVHPLYPYYHLAGAENELRERERLAKMGADIKPPDPLDPHNPNIHQITPSAVAMGLPVGAIPASLAGQQLAMEQQLQLRQYQAAQFLNSLPPGTNPQSALALAAAHLPPGMIAGAPINPEVYAERISQERLQAERLAAEQYQLELLHHHSHSHVHSHLHLHPAGQPGGPPPPAGPLPIGPLPPPPTALAVADQLMSPYAAAAAMQAMNPFAAASAGNPMLNPMLRSPHAALMHQGIAAGPHLHAAAAAAREHAPQPHPFSHHLQAVHEQHVIDQRRAAAALQEQQYLAARFKP